MKGKFPEFFQSSEYKDIFDEKSLIVLDTNILLNTYRYSKDVQNSLIQAIEENIDNIFIPHQVGLEFVLNKRKVSSKIINGEQAIDNRIEENFKQLQNNINNIIREFEANIDKELEDFRDSIEECLNNERVLKCSEEKKQRQLLIKKLKKVFILKNNDIFRFFNYSEEFKDWKENYLLKYYELIPELELKDEYGDKIAELFNGKVGDPFTQDEIDIIEKEGELRYKMDIPPGYKDADDTNGDNHVTYGNLKYTRKYGDLILWKQIIDYLKTGKNKYNKIYFITDDIKEDWYHIEKGIKIGKKRIGTRYELRKEMIEETNCFLRLKDTNDFIKMSLKIDEDLIEHKDGTDKNNLNDKYLYNNKAIIKDIEKIIFEDLIKESLVNNQNIIKYKSKVDKENDLHDKPIKKNEDIKNNHFIESNNIIKSNDVIKVIEKIMFEDELKELLGDNENLKKMLISNNKFRSLVLRKLLEQQNEKGL